MYQIIARWLRLAFPTYIIVFYTLSMFIYTGDGPAFYEVVEHNIIEPLREYWWTIILFIQNVKPWEGFQGIYWISFVANDLQFYILIMMPSIYLYLSTKRAVVLSYLIALIALSIVYVFYVSALNDFSSILTIKDNLMFNELYRRPFGPMGYYALGILLSLFYFEYQQAISNRDLRTRKAYRFLSYIGRSKKRQYTLQTIGALVMVFVLFIRFTSFQDSDGVKGRWGVLLNSLFNCLAGHLFTWGLVLVFLPIFIGRLTIIRDIFASSFFRPFARVSFTAMLI